MEDTDMAKVKIGVISFEHMHALSYTTALTKMADEVELVRNRG